MKIKKLLLFCLTAFVMKTGTTTAQCTQYDPSSVYVDLEDNLPCGSSCGTPTTTPFEIWSNEAYILGELTSGSNYDFTLGASAAWPPTITVAEWNGTNVGAVIGFVDGRNLSVTIPTTGDYIVILSITGNCNGASTNSINNGALSIDCGVGGATCPCTPTTGTDTRTECNSFNWIDGNNYTASNNTATFNIVGGAANGCDSLVTLDLTIINSATGTDTRTECNSFNWIDGNNYTASNNTATFNIVGGAANGCDSLVTLDLTIINSATGTDTRTECNSFNWIDGNNYTASNNTATFNIVGGAANGCDSLVTLDLTIINSATGTDTRTECNSFNWIDGNNYTASNNTATFNIVGGAANGCDSLVTLDLTIINSATGTDTRTECNSFNWIDGNNYTASNNTATFNIVGGAANGCDSLVTLDLTIINSATGTDTRTECNSFNWIDGNNYTASNNTATFNIVGGAANGCDSLVTLDLTIINSATGTDTRTECNSFNWIDGNNYTASNNTATFNIVGGAANGCDSLVTLDLTIINSAIGTDTRTECNSFNWIDGNNYTASNNTATFNIVGGAANGCDSLITLDLTINSVSDLTTSTSGTTISASNIGASYQWLDCDNNNSEIAGETGQSFTAFQNGNYSVELTENSCVDTSDCVVITTVGLVESSFGDKFNVYPNPTEGDFSINLGDIYENSEVLITDLSGKLIDSKTITQSQTLNLSIKEPAGIYIVSIQADDKKAVIRLIKE